MMPTAHSVPLGNIWHMLRYAWRLEMPLGAALPEEGEAHRAENLFAHLLVALLPQLLQRGLLLAYREHIDEYTVPRGRILLSETYQNGAHLRRKLVCAEDDMTCDVLANRVIKAAMLALLAVPTLHRHLARSLRSFLPHFADVAPAGADDAPKAYRSVKDRAYRNILLVCLLMHRASFVDPSLGTGGFFDVQLSAREMGLLFQRFLRAFYLAKMRSWPRSQRLRLHPGDLDWGAGHAALPSLVTDIRFAAPHLRLVIEVKCSQKLLKKYLNADKLPAAHVNQLYSYLHALTRLDPGTLAAAKPRWRGALIYGYTQSPMPTFTGSLAEFQVSIHNVNLSGPWADVEAQAYQALLDTTADGSDGAPAATFLSPPSDQHA